MSQSEFGLLAATIDMIRSILAEVPAVQKAVIYGSRVKGNYRPGSDIDLSLYGDALDLDTLGRIATRLNESPIPYQVDLAIFDLIDHPGLREHIERVGQPFYKAQKAQTSGNRLQ